MTPCVVCSSAYRHAADCPFRSRTQVACVHCGKASGRVEQRRLCQRCYRTPAVRNKYPPAPRRGCGEGATP